MQKRESLRTFYLSAITPKIISQKEQKRFITRVNKGKLTREENPISHTCAMIMAFDPETKKVLVVHHKKANSWLFPGGHIDFGELPSEAALREAEEELGLINKNLIGPFGAQILDIDNPPQICREHFDLFYALSIHQSDIIVDMKEFHGYEWLTLKKVYERITLEYYRAAFDKFIRFMKW